MTKSCASLSTWAEGRMNENCAQSSGTWCPPIRRATDWKCPNWPGNPTPEALPPSGAGRHPHFAGSARRAALSGPGDTYTEGCFLDFLNYSPLLVRSPFFCSFLNGAPTTESQNFLRRNQEQRLVPHTPSAAQEPPAAAVYGLCPRKHPLRLRFAVIRGNQPAGAPRKTKPGARSHTPRGSGPRDQRSAGNNSV